MADEQHPVKLPGFGLAHEQSSGLPIAKDWYPSPITLRERAMLSLMLALKDKPKWDRKVMRDDIVTKWRTISHLTTDQRI